MAVWARTQIGRIAVVGALAVVLVVVRLAVPDLVPMTTALGYCAALAGLLASFLIRRRVRALNKPAAGLDRERARRIGEATRAKVAVTAEDAPAARAVYAVGIAEWARFAWAFAGATQLGLAFGLMPSSAGVWTLAVGLLIAVLSAVFASIALVSVVRLRAQWLRVPNPLA